MRKIIQWFYKLFGINSTNPINPLPQPIIEISEIKQKLLDLHNKERLNKNLPLLVLSVELDKSAQLHNDYMAKNKNLTHNEPGRPIGTRVKEQGYNWYLVGENIAYGQETPEAVVNAWMNSSGHRANILNNNYRDVGFGVTLVEKTWWWTANFGKRQ